MAIDQSYLNLLSESCKAPYVEQTYTFIMPKIITAINKISDLHPEINLQNILIYKQGAYANNTFVSETTRLELVVEVVRSDRDIDLELARLVPSFKRPSNDMKELYTLPEFKNDLHIALMDLLKIPNIVKSNRTIHIPKGFRNFLEIDILPAFKAAEYPKGANLLVFDSFNNKYLVSYPSTHEKNMHEKDQATKGLFKEIVRITRRLKNILIDNQVMDEGFAPGYFIDCLLYNVPNTLYNGELDEIFLKILNYLKITNLANFVCAHENLKMFNNDVDSWDYTKARKFIDLLIYSWQNLELV